MSESLQRVQNDIAETRAHLQDTAAELRDVVSANVHAAKEKVDPRTYVRRFPWAALGIAVGAGAALALTGAECKAAEAAIDGAKNAGTAIGSGAVSAKDAIVDKVKGNDEPAGSVAMRPEVHEPPRGIRGKIKGAIDELLYAGLQEILKAFAPEPAQTQMSVGATGPRSPVSSDIVASEESLAS